MSHILPNFNDPVIQAYGIPLIHERRGDLFADRPWQEKVPIAVLDQPISGSNKFDFWQNLKEIPDNGVDDDGNGIVDDITGANFYDPPDELKLATADFSAGGGHGNMAGGTLFRTTPELIAVMRLQIASFAGAGHFDMLDAALYAIKMGAAAFNVSWESTSGTLMGMVLGKADVEECIWLTHAGRGNGPMSMNYPAWYGDRPEFKNLLVQRSMLQDGTPTSGFHDKKCGVTVLAGHPSGAAPQSGGMIAMLKFLDSTIRDDQIVQLIKSGAGHNEFTDGKSEHGLINYANTLLEFDPNIFGTVVPIPEPLPEIPTTPFPQPPEPEEKKMQLSKPYQQEQTMPWGIVGTDARSPTNEDITELLGMDASKKFLQLEIGTVVLEYVFKEPVTLTHGYIFGANDTTQYPAREAVGLIIDSMAGLKGAKLPLSLPHGQSGKFSFPALTSNRFIITIRNKHWSGIVQFGPLVFPEMGDPRFIEIQEEPLSEPEVDPSERIAALELELDEMSKKLAGANIAIDQERQKHLVELQEISLKVDQLLDHIRSLTSLLAHVEQGLSEINSMLGVGTDPVKVLHAVHDISKQVRELL